MEEDIDRRKSGDGKKSQVDFPQGLGVERIEFESLGHHWGKGWCVQPAVLLGRTRGGSEPLGRVTCCTRSQKTLLSGFSAGRLPFLL